MFLGNLVVLEGVLDKLQFYRFLDISIFQILVIRIIINCYVRFEVCVIGYINNQKRQFLQLYFGLVYLERINLFGSFLRVIIVYILSIIINFME